MFDLWDIKLQLGIKDQKIEIRDDKKKQQKVLQQNINFSELSYDFRCNSESDYELKVLYYVYHTFKGLESIDDKLNSFLAKNPSIYSYTDGQMKSSLNYYQKIDRLFRFFEKLEQKTVEVGKDKKNYSLLHILFGPYGILQTIYNVKPDGKTPLLLNKATQHILSFTSLRSLYMTTQETLFKEKRSLPEGLKDFEDLYLQELGKNDERYLHNLCFTLGAEIGRFLGSIDEERAIFGLRNIKNHKQLVGRINDFAFLLLKKSSEGGIGKETKELITILLDSLNKDNWEIVKDYLGIYIIQKYQSVQYAKSPKGN